MKRFAQFSMALVAWMALGLGGASPGVAAQPASPTSAPTVQIAATSPAPLPAASQEPAGQAPQPADLTHGRTLYVAHCGRCHGIGRYAGQRGHVHHPGPRRRGHVSLDPQGRHRVAAKALRREPHAELRRHRQRSRHQRADRLPGDANQIPVLIDAEFGGRQRKLLAMANRNAFYYVLDRESGEFLVGTPYSRQTWAEGLDENGRPIVIPGTEPSAEGTLVWPSLQGATNWFSPSYSPLSELFYVPTREMAAVYFKADADYEPGQPFMGGGEQALRGDQSAGSVRALDMRTGELRWEFDLQSPPWAGVMATAGGLVFGGSDGGNFFALDDATGESLWEFQTGGAVHANPMSYMIDGRQYVAIASGGSLFVFGLGAGSDG